MEMMFVMTRAMLEIRLSGSADVVWDGGPQVVSAAKRVNASDVQEWMGMRLPPAVGEFAVLLLVLLAYSDFRHHGPLWAAVS